MVLEAANWTEGTEEKVMPIAQKISFEDCGTEGPMAREKGVNVAVMLGGEVVLAVGSKGRGDSRKRDNREWVPIRIAGDREISGILWTAGPPVGNIADCWGG